MDAGPAARRHLAEHQLRRLQAARYVAHPRSIPHPGALHLPGHVGRPELHGWTPAIHMFRWASRIIREVTQLRVEKLQEISEADAIAEGIQRYAGPLRWVRYLDAITGEATHSSARDAYFSLWEALHGPGSVDADPWLCALSFKEV